MAAVVWYSDEVTRELSLWRSIRQLGVEFWYALAVVILIPLLLIANTWLLLRAMHRDVNFALRREAALLESALDPFLVQLLNQPAVLRERLGSLRTAAPEILSATVLVVDRARPGVFTPLASTAGDPSQESVSPLNAFVLSTGEPHATLVRDRETGTNAWSVIAPLHRGTEIPALFAVKVSTKDIDVLLSRTTRVAVIVLVGTVVVTILLLLNHVRFFAYVALVRKLREVDRMKDEFISMASHELRGPLTTVKGYASMLKEAQLQRAPEKTMTEVDLLLAEIDRLSALVDDLLDVTRIQQGRVRFDLQPVSLHGLLSGVVDVLRHEVERKGLTLRYDPPDRELRVSADPQRLQQVFVNIVGNAIKYTEKGEVSIRHEVRGNNVATMVTDTGIGMSPEDREQLFSKFYRIRTTETQKISGTGLGLWITKQIIEHLGGKIYTDSMKERGSQFTVLLPLLAEGTATTSGADAR